MVKIVADSGCDFTDDMKNKKGIDITLVPLSLQLGENHYIDDDTLNVTDYLLEMKKCPTVPKSAAPSPELYFEAFKGDESVFCVTITSALSGSFNSANLARQMYLDEIGEKFIHVFDSRATSTSVVLIALKINEYAKQNLPDLDIVKKVSKFINEMNFYFILGSFDNLVKTGRVNPTIAKIASFLSLKPICHGTSTGEIEMLDKVRGYNKAASKLIDIIKNNALNVDFEGKVLAIAHVDCLDKALAFKEEIMKKIEFKDIVISECRGLAATYSNSDSIFVSY